MVKPVVDVKRESRLLGLKDDLMIGRDAEKLEDNKAWGKLVEYMKGEIKEVQDLKSERNTVDYIIDHKVKGEDGKEVWITGRQLMEQQIRDEIRAGIYEETLLTIHDYIVCGKQSEEDLRKEIV